MPDASSPSRGQTAIVGVGTTAQGELPSMSADAIAVDALGLALADAGLEKGDLDGLITCRSFGGFGIDTEIGRLAGLNPRFAATLDYGTCNFSLHLAAMAIASGMASTIALVYGTNQRTSGNRFAAAAGSGAAALELHGFHNIAGQGALAFARHAHLYGTTEAQLGHVAVTERAHAQLNPAAIFKEPLTIEGYLAQPYLVEPLRRADVCMISDGGACLIVTAADRATASRTTPVHLLAMRAGRRGCASTRTPTTCCGRGSPRCGASTRRRGCAARTSTCSSSRTPSASGSSRCSSSTASARRASRGPSSRRDASPSAASFPVNTNGGQLSESYMWGWLHLCEAVRQLRGECGPRQVHGATFAQYCSTKGFEKAATSILGTVVPR